MSAASQKKFVWIQQNYEMLLLVIVLMGLLISAAILMIRTSQHQQELDEARWESITEGKMTKPVDPERYEQLLGSIQQPFGVGSYSNRMFVSELRVWAIGSGKPVPYDALQCTFTGAGQPAMVPELNRDSDLDRMPDVFEEKYGFNKLNPDDADQDMDGDGFKNWEEYSYDTDPSDPNSYPPLTAKLRLTRTIPTPFKLRFTGRAELPGGRVQYQLNLRSLTRTYFVEKGESIEGFELTEYRKDVDGREFLVLKKGEQTITLEKNKVINADEWVADMIFLINRERMRKRVDEKVVLKGEEYKVIDIGRDRVLLSSLTTGEPHKIETLSETEKEEIQGLHQDASGTEGFTDRFNNPTY